MKRSKPLARRTPLRSREPLSRGKCRLKKSKLSAVSRKQREKNQCYSKVRKEFLRTHPYCHPCQATRLAEFDKLGFPITPLAGATQIHHQGKRFGKWLCDTRYFLPVCSRCHHAIEQNRKWAESQGYTLTVEQVRKVNEER